MVKHRVARRQAMTYIEVLVAALLLSIGLMAMVQMWSYSYLTTNLTDDKGIAYNLGRQAVETVKMSGFSNAAEGPVTVYYDGNEAATAQAQSRFTVTTTIVSSSVTSGTAGVAGAVPALSSLRTVTVTVKYTSGGSTLYSTNSYLSRGGI